MLDRRRDSHAQVRRRAHLRQRATAGPGTWPSTGWTAGATPRRSFSADGLGL